MSEHPLGNIDGTETQTHGLDAAKSVADTMFKLDEFLSGDVRRAELPASFYLEAHLDVEIGSLEAEHASLIDSQGRPLEDPEQTLEASGRSASVVMSELVALRARKERSRRTIKLRAMGEDDYAAFEQRHRKAIEEGTYPVEFWEELIVASAVPKMTVDEVRQFRARASHAVYSLVGNTAYRANTMAGVFIPKSLTF